MDVEVSERWVVVEVGSDFPLAVPIHTLITVGNVEEKVLFMMLLMGGEKRKNKLASPYIIDIALRRNNQRQHAG